MGTSALYHKVVVAIVFALIGIYGGFIQAGVGFIIIAALTLINRFDLVRANAIKLFVSFFFTIAALCIFIIRGKCASVFRINTRTWKRGWRVVRQSLGG